MHECFISIHIAFSQYLVYASLAEKNNDSYELFTQYLMSQYYLHRASIEA